MKNSRDIAVIVVTGAGPSILSNEKQQHSSDSGDRYWSLNTIRCKNSRDIAVIVVTGAGPSILSNEKQQHSSESGDRCWSLNTIQ